METVERLPDDFLFSCVSEYKSYIENSSIFISSESSLSLLLSLQKNTSPPILRGKAKR